MISLVAIDRDGTARGVALALDGVAGDVVRGTTALYDAVGFQEPWIGYIAMRDGIAIGTCAFKSPPLDGRVEIAYFTFPEFEGRGVASAMAAELVAMAQRGDPSVTVAAQTLPARNASHRILEKLGFEHVDTLEHPEDGTVWEWQLPRAV
ncbi:MAG: GNAT family N-acetyltransferase [Gemmatimonadaceae bacterium]|jgi:RimJ/RimL family protein N-acetyltransferase|nr:GNAT family N-acetyltransferase [Gemmatimonadaceae bacterium]